MNQYIIGVFDSFNQSGDVIFYLKDKSFNHLSLIGLNPSDSIVSGKLEGDEELSESIGPIESGALTGAVIVALESIIQIDVPRLGSLILGGEIADILSISEYLQGEKLGGLTKAFEKDLGFNRNNSIKYADNISNGQVLVLVKSSKSKIVLRIFDEFGALENDVIKLISPK
jgi:hypothetical protein